MLLALVLAQALPLGNPEGPIFSQPSLKGLAAFEAFSPGGQGTSGVCSTTAATGAKGEVLVFSRASTAMCTRTATGGLATTGIATGDLVSLTNDKARVEYDSTGKLKLLEESAGKNFCLQSDAIDNAIWTKESSGAVTQATANAATAPDNTATADRLQAIATSGAGFADIYQAWTTGAIADPTTCSAYVRGNATNDTTDICGFDGASWGCAACVYVSPSWSRCVYTDLVGSTSTSRFCKLGNNSTQNGGVARNALDAFTWCLQGESKDHATSCMNTAAATATRAVELPYFAVASMSVQSIAVTVETSGAYSSNARLLAVTDTTTTTLGLYAAGTGGSPVHVLQFVGGPTKDLADGNLNINARSRAYAWFTPSSTIAVAVNGVETSSAAGVLGAVTATRIYPSYEGGAGFELDGLIGEICVDPSPTRCR